MDTKKSGNENNRFFFYYYWLSRTHISSLRRTLVICIIWWGFYSQPWWPFSYFGIDLWAKPTFQDRLNLTHPTKLRKPERENGVLSFFTRRRSCPICLKVGKKKNMSGLLYLNTGRSIALCITCLKIHVSEQWPLTYGSHLLREYDAMTVRLSQIRLTLTPALGRNMLLYTFMETSPDCHLTDKTCSLMGSQRLACADLPSVSG